VGVDGCAPEERVVSSSRKDMAGRWRASVVAAESLIPGLLNSGEGPGEEVVASTRIGEGEGASELLRKVELDETKESCSCESRGVVFWSAEVSKKGVGCLRKDCSSLGEGERLTSRRFFGSFLEFMRSEFWTRLCCRVLRGVM
jgi:hypothetical protein